MLAATPAMRRAPIDSTRACSMASKAARPSVVVGDQRRCSASLWQAIRSAKLSAQPRAMAASRALSLRGGSGRRALTPSSPAMSEGRSGEKLTSRSGDFAIARIVPASERLNGSWGESLSEAGRRFVGAADMSPGYRPMRAARKGKQR